ncbi:hypothetical protein AB6A40_006198 [Gnathostoma spinigerum]|uniref:Peptidase metallopeptidase domain-containing protein n=1 Tax=Gnathostoma spinigerum TaxID=75299 RepID=A0ABD6EQB2_9BILA
MKNNCEKGDLDILFAKFEHGDKEAFDGVGGIIAHSGYPVEGLVHFDASEHWSTTGRTGLDIRHVALHEIGHAFGLEHSNDPNAVMYPYYMGQVRKGFWLTNDDVDGIREAFNPLRFAVEKLRKYSESKNKYHAHGWRAYESSPAFDEAVTAP